MLQSNLVLKNKKKQRKEERTQAVKMTSWAKAFVKPHALICPQDPHHGRRKPALPSCPPTPHAHCAVNIPTHRS